MRLFLLFAATTGVLSAASARTHTVTQKDKLFGAATLTVAVGDTIVFRNDDDVVHNVFTSSPDFKFNLRSQAPGTSAAVAFDTPGAHSVRCAIHPTMKLSVTVTP